MKLTAVILVVCLLCGCSREDDALDQAMNLRKRLLDANTCCFQAVVTADYTDVLYTFQMECAVDHAGDLEFTVVDPETIAGITGRISQSKSALTFDDKVLAFPMLADGEFTPVSAPWIFYHSLRGGYLSGCSREDNGYTIYVDDSYEENPLHLLICTDENMTPNYVQIIRNDRRILSMDIRDFTIQ